MVRAAPLFESRSKSILSVKGCRWQARPGTIWPTGACNAQPMARPILCSICYAQASYLAMYKDFARTYHSHSMHSYYGGHIPSHSPTAHRGLATARAEQTGLRRRSCRYPFLLSVLSCLLSPVSSFHRFLVSSHVTCPSHTLICARLSCCQSTLSFPCA